MILFSDFDKTIFFRGEPEKTEKNLAAIEKWRNSGHLFVITTGRSILSLNSIFPKDHSDFFLTDNGSNLYDSDQNLLETVALGDDEVEKIFETVKSSAPAQPIAIFYNSEGEGTEIRKNLTKIRLWFEKTKDAEDFLSILQKVHPKTFICKDPGGSFYEEVNDFEAFLEIAAENSGKNLAIERFRKERNLEKSEIIVVGDSKNDRDMLKDFDGFMISGSELEKDGETFKKVDSVASLIENLLSKNLA